MRVNSTILYYSQDSIVRKWVKMLTITLNMIYVLSTQDAEILIAICVFVSQLS